MIKVKVFTNRIRNIKLLAVPRVDEVLNIDDDFFVVSQIRHLNIKGKVSIEVDAKRVLMKANINHRDVFITE